MHGTNDKKTPYNEAREIFSKVSEPKTLDIVEEADYVFSNNEHRKYLFDRVVEWFKRTLK